MKPARQNGAGVYYGIYILAMLIFGTNGYLVAHLSLQGSQIVLVRTLVGGLLLTAIVLLRGGFDREAVRAEWRDLLFGGVALGLNWVALFTAYRLLNVSLATLIYYAGPMLVLLFSPLLFRESLTPQKIAAVAIVAAGLFCITGSITSAGMSLTGLLAAVLSALFYASLIIFNKRIVKTGGMQTAALELDVAFVVVAAHRRHSPAAEGGHPVPAGARPREHGDCVHAVLHRAAEAPGAVGGTHQLRGPGLGAGVLGPAAARDHDAPAGARRRADYRGRPARRAPEADINGRRTKNHRLSRWFYLFASLSRPGIRW